MKGFKDFILRGNIVDLAVAVVIGTAFAALVTTITDNLINPLLATLGDAEAGGFGILLDKANKETFIDFGAMITAGINFVLIAAVVYFVIVLPLSKVLKAKDEDPSQEELLTEIRDLLAKK